MESTIQRRHAAERERIERCTELLRQSARRRPRAPDVAQALEDVASGFVSEAVRDAAAWHPQLKTRDSGKLRLAAARRLFARYPVPSVLEHIWMDDTGLSADEVWLRKRWYVTVAGGGSLHKAGLCRMLSRKEVHVFLNATAGLGFEAALWMAIARSYTDDVAVALRIARSKIARMPRDEIDFWRTVARFFCCHIAPLETLNDLCDYLADCHRRDPHYRIEGRTLRTLNRQMHEWHRDIAAIQRIEYWRRQYCGAGSTGGAAESSWSGSRLANWEWVPAPRHAQIPGECYVVTQLKRAEDLVAEGRAMRHCVSSYAGACLNGCASIWSLKRRVRDRFERLLTLELNATHQLVQVRGFANRLPNAQELMVLDRWMKDRHISQDEQALEDQEAWGL